MKNKYAKQRVQSDNWKDISDRFYIRTICYKAIKAG